MSPILNSPNQLFTSKHIRILFLQGDWDGRQMAENANDIKGPTEKTFNKKKKRLK